MFRTFDTPTEPDDELSDSLEAPASIMDLGLVPPDAMTSDARDLGTR